MVENRDGQDMVEKSCVSQSWNFNDVARFWALWSFVLLQPGQETGSGMDALCLLFNHNVAPFLCIMAAESGKKLPHRSHIPLQRLGSTQCHFMPHWQTHGQVMGETVSKRGGGQQGKTLRTWPGYASKLATLWLKSQLQPCSQARS